MMDNRINNGKYPRKKKPEHKLKIPVTVYVERYKVEKMGGLLAVQERIKKFLKNWIR